MSSNARRSERLRRKRQSTPGLSQPGAYSLYGSGYVVESEASFLPPSTPPHSRRIRYKDSPHVFADNSPILPSKQPSASAPPSRPPQTNSLPHHPPHPDPTLLTTPGRRASLVDRVRLSLFDILGSEARRPATNHWTFNQSANRRASHTSAEEQPQDDDDVIVYEEDRYNTHHADIQPQSSTTQNLITRLRTHIHLSRRTRYLLPILLLLTLFLLSFPTLLLLESTLHPRAPYFQSANRPPLVDSLHQTCLSTLSNIPRPTLPQLPSLPFTLPSPKTAMLNILSATETALRYLFRGAWSTPVHSPANLVSRDELRSIILPDLLAVAKKTAAEEAARVSRQLSPASSTLSRSADNFNTFAERYAADKGLPADYALLSVGAAVVTSDPSTPSMYVRFVRQYVEALVTQSKYSPLVPNRPQMALTPDVLPGNCWAFPGEKGSLTIRLARPVKPTSVTMEHTPKRSVFSTLSAPRRFRVYGVPMNGTGASVGRKDMVLLGEFVFDMADEKRHLQSFVLKPGSEVEEMRAVKIEIVSNHGAPHTCLYRVRVHGTEAEKPAM